MIRNARLSVITNYYNPTLCRPKIKKKYNFGGKRTGWYYAIDPEWLSRLQMQICYMRWLTHSGLLEFIYWDGWISRNPVRAKDFRWHSLALFSEQTILCFPRTIAFLEMHKYCTKSWRWWMNLLWPLPLYIKRKTYNIKISSICSLYI